MASQIIIGRFGLDIETSELDTWDMGGDRVQVSGEIYCDTVAEALAARQQILGLADNSDEPLVPVYWVEDTSLDGIYEVVSSSVDTAQMTLTEGVLPWSAVLRRPRGSASMVTESIISGAGRDGYFGVLTPRYWVAVPGGGYESTGALSGPFSTRKTFDPTTASWPLILHDASMADATVTSYAPPESHYYGAATLKVGAQPYTAIGRQIANTADEWEITNGIVTVTSPANTSDLCDIQFAEPTGFVASTVTHSLQWGYFSGSWFTGSFDPDTITCNRNGREEVSIRLRGTFGTVDISLRRGDRGAIFTIRGQSLRYGLGWTATTASTVIDAANKGIYANAADADTNIPILVASGTVTRDLTNGRVYRSAAGTSTQVYAGATYTGASAPDTAVWLQEAFYAAMGETARVVSVG